MVARYIPPNEAATDDPVARMRDVVLYEDAVNEARNILKQFDSGQMRLGELADKLEPRYGDSTLKRFADEIDIAVCTVGRYRDVYRSWKDISAPGRDSISYSVARELAAHPDRAGIITRNPSITKRQASELMRAYHEPETKTENESETEQTKASRTNDWQEDLRRGFRQALTLADACVAFGQQARGEFSPELEQQMRAVYEPLRRQVPEAKKKAQGLVDYFDRIETILNVLAEVAE